jgi:hypothetical protein
MWCAIMYDQPAQANAGAAAPSPPKDPRAAPRYRCRARPVLRVVLRPSLEPFFVRIKDLSLRGAGLICADPIEPGSVLTVGWVFGPEDSWRTIRARVVRLAPLLYGGWVLGCVFKERLRPTDLEALVRHDQELASPPD